MYYKKVPDDFSILTFGYERLFDSNGISICKVIEELHRVYHFSIKSLKEKIVKELVEDKQTIYYCCITSQIFLTSREKLTMIKVNGFWVSHYSKR